LLLFKSPSIESIVRTFVEPRASRNPKHPGDELWVPNIEEFLGCNDAEKFKNIFAIEKEHPPTDLWMCTQSFWIHSDIFKIIDMPQRA
jgi:hypothetical protein